MKGLSLRQPWAHAIIHGGKRIENRVNWANSHFRGEFLIHTAQGMTRGEYFLAEKFAVDRGLVWRPPAMRRIEGEGIVAPALKRGGIVSVARVVDVVRADKGTPSGATRGNGFGLTPDEAKWWMGGFAFVLEDVRETPFVECKGALGFFKVPDDVARKALGGG